LLLLLLLLLNMKFSERTMLVILVGIILLLFGYKISMPSDSGGSADSTKKGTQQAIQSLTGAVQNEESVSDNTSKNNHVVDAGLLKREMLEKFDMLNANIRKNEHHLRDVKVAVDDLHLLLLRKQQQPLMDVQASDDPMMKVHQRVYHKHSPEDIQEIFNRQRNSYAVYGSRVLDIEKDRKSLMALFPSPNEKRDRIVDQLYTRINVSDVKTIFLAGFSDVNNKRKFSRDNCNVKQCRFTSDRKYLATADAIYSESMYIPKARNLLNKNQIKIFLQLESARNYPAFSNEKNLNWSASYRLDSVLNAPYERYTPFLNITEFPTKTKQNYASGKTKMAAWFVSHCEAPSGRRNFVRELQKYLPVDIYGKCGKQCLKTDQRCFEQLNTDYKFYLAFENSVCKDYYTEKLFWNGLL